MYPVRSSFPCLKIVNTFVNVVYNLYLYTLFFEWGLLITYYLLDKFINVLLTF